MALWSIYNKKSGQSLGEYEADTAVEAWAECAADADSSVAQSQDIVVTECELVADSFDVETVCDRLNDLLMSKRAYVHAVPITDSYNGADNLPSTSDLVPRDLWLKALASDA